MIEPDFINACFELLATFFVLNHARVLWVSKQCRGVSLVSTIFFTSWGAWNVFYYPHLGQILSFYAGIGVLIANFIWIGVIWYLRSNEDVRAS